MPTVLSKVLVDKEYWIRLAIFQHEPLKKALLNIFHNPKHGGLSRDPRTLYQELKQREKDIKKINAIKEDQLLLIFPSSGETDSSKFDVTLLAILIRNCLTLKPPTKGWKCKTPADTDLSIAADVIRAREWRNFIHHTDPDEIDQVKFEERWQLGVDIIIRIGFHYDVDALKNAVLDPTRMSVIESVLDCLMLEQDRMRTTVDENVSAISNLNSMIEKTVQLKDDVSNLRADKERYALNKTDVVDGNSNLLKNEDSTVKDVRNTERIELQVTSMLEAHNLFKTTLSILQNYERQSSTENSSKLVLNDVLARTCEIIGPQWKSLAHQLGVPSEYLNEIATSVNDHKELMSLCFEKLKGNLLWSDLKAALKIVRRVDIIDDIINKSLVTYGLRNAYVELQKKYITELINWYMTEPFMGHDGISTSCLPREEAYVDLAIIQASEMDKFWSVSERDFHLKLKHFDKAAIRIEDILEKNDNLVLARGIAGIGKSTLIDTFVLKWAKGDILTGTNNDPKIDFVFKFSCRDLNMFKDIKSPENILKETFPTIFDFIDIEDLQDISHRVLMVIDGVDELQSFSDLKPHHMQIKDQTVLTVFDLMNPKSDFLKGHKALVTARPEACRNIISYMKRKLELKMIEVCGFSPTNIDLYIRNYFGRNEKVIKKIKDKINESENLLAMSSIPVYLWVICGIFKEDLDIETPLTTTHLSTYACLIFLRNHFKHHSVNFRDFSLYELCNNKEIIEVVWCLAEMSELTIREGKVVFRESEAGNLNHLFEKTGFICKHLYGERGSFYQFRHLVLQEYFAALYIYLTSQNIIEDMSKPYFLNCRPFIAGLSGNENKHDNDFLKILISNLHKHKFPMDTLPITQNAKLVSSYLANCISSRIDNNCLFVDDSFLTILSAVYEHQNPLTVSTQQDLSVNIDNVHQQHDIKNLLHLVDVLQVAHVKRLYVNNVGNQTLARNFIKLIKLYFDSNITEGLRVIKKLVLVGKSEMSVDSETKSFPLLNLTCKTIFISLAGNIQKDKSFLLNLVSSVAEIELDITLDSSYPEIKQLLVKNCFQKYQTCVTFRNVIEYFSNEVENEVTIYELMLLADCAEQSIRKNKEFPLKELKINTKTLTDEHLHILKPALFQIQTLDLKWNKLLTGNGISAITSSLQSGLETCGKTWLRSLNLVQCDLKESEIQVLSSVVIFLHQLDISWNQHIPPSALMYLSNAVINKNLRFDEKKRLSLKMSNCNLTDEHIFTFHPCICYLELFDISMNEGLSPDVMPFFTLSSHFNNRHLLSLDLRCCKITDEHIVELLPAFTQLNKLILDGNPKLTPKAMQLINDVIIKQVNYDGNTINLKYLSFKFCNLTDKHIEPLYPAIQYITKLKFYQQ